MTDIHAMTDSNGGTPGRIGFADRTGVPSDQKWIARFWRKVAVAANSDCWTWCAGKNGNGYGQFFLDGQNRLSHRISLNLFGVQIADGLVVDHICRNRSCVNPAHLRVVDRRTNALENSSANAYFNTLKTHCPKGHPYSGENLIVWRNKRMCRTCRREYQRIRRAS